MFEISWPFFYRCITVVLDEQDRTLKFDGSGRGGSGGSSGSSSGRGRNRRRIDEVQHLELVACVLDLLR